MIVALDFGSALTKAIIYDDGIFTTFKFSLSYSPQQYSEKSILESLRVLEKLSGKSLIDANNTTRNKIYVSTAIPLILGVSGRSIATEIVSSSAVLLAWERNILDLGYQFIRFRENVSVINYDVPSVLKWLPFKATLSEVSNYIDDRKIYSNLLPIFPRDLYIEQAVARESIANFFSRQSLTPVGQEITVSGSIFSVNPFLSQSSLILMDSLNFINRLDVFIDLRTLIICLGLLKMYEPAIFSEIPASLRPVFAGSILRFSTGVNVTIDLGLPKPMEVKVDEGTVFLFPLKSGERAKIIATGTDKKKQEYEVGGGELGLVIDCREFPINLPTDSQRRTNLLKEWEKSLGATGRIHNI